MDDDIELVGAIHHASALDGTGPSRAATTAGSVAEGSLDDKLVWRSPSPDRFAAGITLATAVDAACEAYGPTRSGRRNVPSAGALYSGRVVVADLGTGEAIAMDDTGSPISLVDDRRVDLRELIFGRFEAGTLIVFSMALDAALGRYGVRGYRYALIEAGHFGQELTRTLAKRGYPSRCLGAFNDIEVSLAFGLDAAGLVPLYAVVTGRP